VVRGEDLLASTPRQIYLQRLLGLPHPEYCHLPLVVGPDGQKLSKRDNLISHLQWQQPKSKQALLVAVLRFLGLTPHDDLSESPCSAILQWGVSNFNPLRIPDQGSVLPI
jgi:glutamyl-Q tRNA(Asp) synthetase